MSNQYIELSNLVKSSLNVRKTGSATADEELKASVLAHGLMQNLVVIPAKKKGTFEVIAGGRRLAALHSLQAEGKLPADHAVQCQIADGKQATEMSLAENTVRQAMHPADEYEAFAKLADDGLTAEQTAQRFGVDEKHVLKRLKLGRVAPELLAVYRAGDMTLECLTAFTITDDRKRQLSVYKGLQGWQKASDSHIRKCLTDKMVEGGDKLAVFVGVDVYSAAGGKTRPDLFEETVYLENAELLNRLAGEKLQAIAESLEAEGWGWVEVNPESDYSFTSRCARIRPQPVDAPIELTEALEKAEAEQQSIAEQIDASEDEEVQDALYEKDREVEGRLDAIAEQIEAYARFDTEQMKSAGCYVTLGHNGAVRVEKGLVKPGDQKKIAKGQTADAESDAKKKPEFSQSLVADMKAYRTQAAQVEIATHPDVAFDLLVFHVACDVLDHLSPRGCLDVRFSQSYPSPSVEKEGHATKRLEAIENGLPKAWLEIEGEAERFHAFRQLSDADKRRILAYCTALTLEPALAGSEEPSAYEAALSLTGGNVAEYWRPTKDNYLSRISREQLLGIGREVMISGDQWGNARRDDKKGTLVDILDKTFAVSAKPDTRDAIKDWLPKGMGFRSVEAEPVKPAKAKKPKKA